MKHIKLTITPVKCFLILLIIGNTALWSMDENQIRIKLATLAPNGSVWISALEEMAQKWEEETNGFVKLVIYPGGVVGDESHVVRKMRIGQFNAATLTTVGLSNLDSAVTAFHIPLLYQSYEELDYVREKLADDIYIRLRDAGFVVLNWGDAGWVHFFTHTPITRPDELRTMKLFVWSNESGDMFLWKRLGFNPIPLAATDIALGLNTGLINALDTTPLLALSNQWFAMANHMTDLKWAPIVGATVITSTTWNNIPTEYQKVMLRAAKDMERKLMNEIRALNEESVKVMEEHGLIVHQVKEQDYELWKELVQEAYPYIRGRYVSEIYFDKAFNLLDEYRLNIKTNSKDK
jgi:TRAP-type C4-dicarboxylate transport system substrate-binding protein